MNLFTLKLGFQLSYRSFRFAGRCHCKTEGLFLPLSGGRIGQKVHVGCWCPTLLLVAGSFAGNSVK